MCEASARPVRLKTASCKTCAGEEAGGEARRIRNTQFKLRIACKRAGLLFRLRRVRNKAEVACAGMA